MTTQPVSVEPASVKELSQFVRETAGAGESLVACGGGTKQAFGNVAPGPDHIVGLRLLGSVLDYSPVDLMIAVESGITLESIDELLASNGQRLALDAPHRSLSTLGGVFAAGLSGPRRLKYGSLKDFIVGLEVLTSEGVVTRSGGMVVKNVSGFELARLHYAGLGSFGIVTRINLRVLPMPESRREVISGFYDAGTCLDSAASLLVSSLDPAAVYAVWSAADGWALHVQFEGSDSFTASQAERVIDRLSGFDHQGTRSSTASGASTPAFDRAIDLRGAPDALVARASVRASQQAQSAERLTRIVGIQLLADPGSGLIYIRCPATEANIEAIVRDAPSTTFLALPDSLKAGRDVFGPMNENAAQVLTRLKKQFDPRGMFGPGRFARFL